MVRETLSRSGQASALAADSARQLQFPRGSLKVESPVEARRLEGLLPGLTATLGDDGGPYLELRPLGTGGDPWRTGREGGRADAADLPLQLRRLGELVIRGAQVQVDLPPAAPRLMIRGQLRTDDVVALMSRTGGFEPSGARTMLALTLGYAPGKLPEAFPLALRAEGIR